MAPDKLEVIGELVYIPEIGDIVLFHTLQFDRPAIVTHVFSEGCVNLCVIPDPTYDSDLKLTFETSVLQGDQIGQWSGRPFEFLETIEESNSMLDTFARMTIEDFK